MYNNDYILRMIEDLGRVLRQVFLQEEEEMFEIVDEEGRFSESDFLGYRVGRLLLERRINEAENLLFDEIERDPQPSFLAVGVHFTRTFRSCPTRSWRRQISPGRRSPRGWKP